MVCLDSVIWISLIVLASLSTSVLTMECYVCHNQEGNRDKCVKTTMQCIESHMTCLTYIQYKTPPYWTMFGERFHFLAKNCTTDEECASLRAEKGRRCQREWYMDWECVECCKGELCNYYATLDGQMVRSFSLTVVLFLAMGVTCLHRLLLPHLLL